MGANLFNQKSNGRKKRIISDINITPFVDVLLVLLIIFMVAAPMMTSSVKVDLPKGAASPTNEKVQPIAVSVKSDGTIYIQDEQVKLSNISAKLLEVTGNNFNSRIQVRADKQIDYGRVMDVIKSINLAGFSQVALVTELTND